VNDDSKQNRPPSPDDEKTAVLRGDQETLNKEIAKAKEQDACLIVIRGSPQAHRFFLSKPSMIIGRDPTVEISVIDQAVSRKHAIVSQSGSDVLLQDLGSQNGTYVNGDKLAPNSQVKLAKEDIVRLGNTMLKYLPAGQLEALYYGNIGIAANTDPLTKVYNKGFLLEALEVEFKRAKALHSDFSLMFLDIDHFKKINDSFGHDCGDQVLKEFTQVIRDRHLRARDVLGRYGGEEFVILLANTPITKAKEIAEAIRTTIEAHHFLYEAKRVPVTTSVGIAEIGTGVESSQTLLKTADKALYASKQGGRNRVSVAS
jgi:two-component system cell cycle response regulator